MTEIRTLTPAEVDLAIDWAATEGWNPGLHDATAFRAQDADGFLGLFEGEDLAAVIAATAYGAGFGFLGLYICRPDLRGRGYGFKLWQAALERLGPRTLGLDGVVAQQDNYARAGFALAHRNIRFGGKSAAFPKIDGIGPIDMAALPAVLGFDRRHFLFDRPLFLEKWLAPPDGAALVARAEGEVFGYGVVRRCRHGHKIGPLFAVDEATAWALYGALSGAAHAADPGSDLFLDVPEPNEAARTLAAEAGLSPVFETARMYRGDAPGLPLARIYGITSLELG
ncbi:GNAT family N-acetyltransferase [Aquabacter spiritensis]|uniref:Acetyltransferase (GNAT) family protein n=1 Tax=Aquabacter spiritensis TaxID=933073 RepID=A0A4R3LY52_9HYPH|nr:GNAT family N-acetyltransferase [Aquabacter spiritensis]TCT05611.1 acetyltransferase (GNAT) family protein [Aquabacter spiritensis]